MPNAETAEKGGKKEEGGKERSHASMYEEACKRQKVSEKDKDLLARAVESRILQNYSPAGELPTICWQHHKNQTRSIHSMQNAIIENDLGRGETSYYIHQPCGRV